MKKQKMLIGGIVKIELSGGKIVLGKLLKEGYMVVYKTVINLIDLGNIDIKVIENSGELLYGMLYNDVITKGIFEIINKSTVSEEELKKIPPRFRMETAHPELCIILYGDGTDRKALPSECIGLDTSVIWEGFGLAELIEDRLSGRLNKYERLDRKELEQGLEIEKELNMKVPWEWWEYNPVTKIMGYYSLLGHPANEWKSIIARCRSLDKKEGLNLDHIQKEIMTRKKELFDLEEFQLLIDRNKSINKYFPFDLGDDKLVLAFIEEAPLYPGYSYLFEKYGYSGNGYCWEGHIAQIVERLDSQLLKHIRFEPEAGVFSVYADSESTQQQFVEILSPIFSNIDELGKWIIKADRSRIDD